MNKLRKRIILLNIIVYLILIVMHRVVVRMARMFLVKFRLLHIIKMHLIKKRHIIYIIGGLRLNLKFQLSIVAVGGSDTQRA